MGGIYGAQGPRAGGNRCSMRLSQGNPHILSKKHGKHLSNTIRPVHSQFVVEEWPEETNYTQSFPEFQQKV